MESTFLVIKYFVAWHVFKQQQWSQPSWSSNILWLSIIQSQTSFKGHLQIYNPYWFLMDHFFTMIYRCLLKSIPFFSILGRILCRYLSFNHFFAFFSFRSVRWIHWRVLNIRNIIKKEVRCGCPCLGCVFTKHVLFITRKLYFLNTVERVIF